jgi:hypothetical protein
MIYQKRPIQVEAFQYGVDDAPEWFTDQVTSIPPTAEEFNLKTEDQYCELFMPTQDAWTVVNKGDYLALLPSDGPSIITPYPETLFNSIYEPVA